MRIIVLASALALASSAAFADDIMAPRYGNTIISKDAAGNENHIYYNADGTFTGKQGTAPFKGTWAIKDGNTICLTSNPAIPNTPNPVCVPVAAHKVGDTWTSGPYTVSLVAGIQ
jgi:hypothetical protein